MIKGNDPYHVVCQKLFVLRYSKVEILINSKLQPLLHKKAPTK